MVVLEERATSKMTTKVYPQPPQLKSVSEKESKATSHRPVMRRTSVE